MNAIELHNVTKRYQDIAVVRDLDLEIGRGEVIGIIGHNGAGKSTTIKMILGLVSPTTGDVRVMGHDMTAQSATVKQKIGYLPEESPLYDNMTIVEYLTFFSRLYNLPRAPARRRMERLLNSLQLSERHRLNGELSKGMRRKVAIARTLLHDPELLVLDEPSSGLDPLTSFFVINYLKRLGDEGKTILVSAHNLFHVEYICDRVAILKEGRLIVYDDMETIRRQLGQRQYEVYFRADEPLDYEIEQGNYRFRTTSIAEMATILRTISERDWSLVNLAVRESALEDIYVKLMTEPAV